MRFIALFSPGSEFETRAFCLKKDMKRGLLMTEQDKEEYVRRWMPKVDEIVLKMNDETIPEEDLKAEGYVGLSSALKVSGESLPEDEETEAAVRGAIQKALEERRALLDRDDKLIVQVELLNESIDRLTKEYNRKPNIDELANDLSISQDKVMDILKLTGEDTGEETQ